ncbi:MAG: ParB/RepB/Spo0J family partition protein, partial [Chloroflexota bacterium]
MQLTDVDLRRMTDNPWQTRRALDPDYIEELAEDIKRNGLLHPPAGRIVLDGQVLDYDLYGGPAAALQDEPDAVVQLAVGHNRKASFYRLSKDDESYQTMPVQIGKYSDQQMAKMAWAENAQRKDLSAVEEARAIQRVIDDFGWTQSLAAEHFGLNRSTITNKLRLLKLPEEVLEHVHAGDISERQAVAMMPVFQMPQPVRERMENPDASWIKKPDELIAEAARGANSDKLRKSVHNLVRAATKDLTDGARFPLDEEFPVGQDSVRSPTCTDCDLCLSYGNETRCGDVGCFDVKQRNWRLNRLQAAQDVCGDLPLLAADVNSWQVEDFSHRDAVHGAAILEEGCPKDCLHLAYRPTYTPEYYLHAESVPEVHVVCYAGGRPCRCLKAAQKAAKTADPRAKAEAEAKKRLKDEIVTPAAEALAEAMLAMQPEIWRLVVEEYVWGVRTEGRDWDKICLSVAKKLLDKQVYHNSHNEPASTRKRIDAMLHELDVQADYPVPASAVDDLRRRYERIKGWADGFEEEMPSAVQLQGNLDNLDQLYQECQDLWRSTIDEGDLDGNLEFIADGGEVTALGGEVVSLQEFIEDVLAIVEEDAPALSEFYTHGRVLFHSAPGSPSYNDVLDRCDPALLRYALTVQRHSDNGHAAHINVLERRLQELE